MGKKIFTDESLATFVDEIKAYTDDAVSTKANSSHTHSSYVNQNAFSNVKVGNTTIAADTTTDTLTIAAGTGISVSGDATNDKVTITNSGVRSIATGGSNGTISVNTNGTSANVAVKGLGSAAYTASTAYDASGTAQTKADAALASAKTYTDTAISNLINGAPTTLDTLGEIATAMAENEDVVEALEDAIGTKANKSDLANYVSKSSTAVQPIMGGLVVGGGSATATGKGRIMITGNSNPLIGLQAINSEGEQLTPYYFQVSNDIMYLGPTSAKALQFNRDGNVSTPGNLTVSGTITEGGTSLPNKYAPLSHTHTVSHTPAGTVSKPTFTGSAVTSGTPSTSSTVASSGHTHSVTAAGSVSQPTFTGTEATISVDYTPVGTVSKPSFTGSAATSGAPSGTATVASSTHTHEYTPAGTVSKPTFTGSAVTSGTPSGTTSVYSITGVGSVPTLTASVTNRCLTLTFTAGSVPTRSSVTLPSTSHTHSVTAAGSVSQPTFTGTEASTTSISGTTSVASSGHTHSVTAKGSVSQPTFTGTEDTISATYTPAGTVSKPTFTGSAATSGAPSGTISVASSGHTHSVTAAGSVSQPTFTGTAATLTSSTPK